MTNETFSLPCVKRQVTVISDIIGILRLRLRVCLCIGGSCEPYIFFCQLSVFNFLWILQQTTILILSSEFFSRQTKPLVCLA